MKSIYTLIILLLFFVHNISVAEEDVLKASHGKNTPSYFDKENLTDREQWDSENFVHEGLSVRTLKEGCEKDEETQSACRGQAANKKFLGMSPGMVQAISRMYATVIGSAGGDMVSVSEYNKAHPDKKSETTTDTNKDSAKATKKQVKNLLKPQKRLKIHLTALIKKKKMKKRIKPLIIVNI